MSLCRHTFTDGLSEIGLGNRSCETQSQMVDLASEVNLDTSRILRSLFASLWFMLLSFVSR